MPEEYKNRNGVRETECCTEKMNKWCSRINAESKNMAELPTYCHEVLTDHSWTWARVKKCQIYMGSGEDFLVKEMLGECEEAYKTGGVAECLTHFSSILTTFSYWQPTRFFYLFSNSTYPYFHIKSSIFLSNIFRNNAFNHVLKHTICD